MKDIIEIYPNYIEKIWGGDFFPKISKSNNVGECILFSQDLEVIDHTWKSNGKRKTVRDVLESKKKMLNEEICKKISSLEVKIIDARENLSVQVHPKRKDEIWYILETKTEAYIYLGLQNCLDKKMIKNGLCGAKILKNLRKYTVEKGDCIYIPGGVVHSLGKGIRTLEMKERGETYRLFDYERKRKLDVEKGICELSIKNEGMIQKGEREGKIGEIGLWEIYKVNFISKIRIPIIQKICIFIFIEGQGIMECLGKTKEYSAGKLYLTFAINEMLDIKGDGKVIMMLYKD